jgi:type II secretory pathway predicted ATPase ExeA
MPVDYFGFKEEPFGVGPNVRFFYYDAARQHVHAHLTSSIREGRGLVLLTGERGVGKTILLRHLADKLAVGQRVALLAPSGVLCCESSPSFADILRACRVRSNASDGAADDERDESGLASFLDGRKMTDPPVALILDGADHLPQEALERLKALSALPADERGRLSIVLSGCLDASEGLHCTAFEAARLNADVSLRLQRFQDRDVKPYVCHRIQLAGRKGPALFAPAAIERIAHYSKGNPLSINRFCRSTLVIASNQTIKTVSAEMVDQVAAGNLRGTTAEASRDPANSPVHVSDLKLPPGVPGVARGSATDSEKDPSPPPQPVFDRTTAATEDAGEKFHFQDESDGDADETTEIAAYARIPSLQPLEEYVPEDRVRSWSRDRAAIAVRLVWVFLAVTLVSGVAGVYLSQTGRFDAIEFTERWLDLLPGRGSTLAEHDPRGPGFVGGQPSRWVEPTGKLDREPPSETKTGSSSGGPRQAAEEQRQGIEERLQDRGSPANAAAEARSEEAFAKTGLSAAPRSLPAPGTATEKAGPGMELIPVAETGESVDRPEGAVSATSGGGTDGTSEITGSTTGMKPLMPADERNAGRESALESGAVTEPGDAAETAKVAAEAGSPTEADQPAASEAAPADMETAAGTEDTADRGEGTVDMGSPTEADQAAASEAAPADMETAAGTEDTVDSGEVAVEASSPTEADQPAASEAAPADMETAAGTEDTADSGEGTAETGSLVADDQPAASEAAPADMETAAGTEDTADSGEGTVEANSPTEADPAASAAVPAAPAPAAVSEDTADSSRVAVETGSPTEADQPAANEAVPAAMETAAGTQDTVEGSVAAAGAEAAAGSNEVMDNPAFAIEPTTDAGPAGSDPLPAGKKFGSAANLGAAVAANGAQEGTVPETARATVWTDISEIRDVPLGLPERESLSQRQSQPAKPEVLAPGEPPTSFRVAETTEPQVDLNQLLARGDQFLALGDVASARLFYRLAATRGSAKGATALGSTYDPIYLERVGIVGTKPSAAEAIKWYRRAIDMGDRAAETRLHDLVSRLEKAAALGDGEARRILDDAGK